MTFPSSPFSLFLADGIARLNDLLDCERFTFVINGTECFAPLIESVLLSPRLFNLIQSDPTTRQFEISDKRIDPEFFSDLIRLICGENVTLTSHSRRSLILICRQFGNSFLEKYIFPFGIGNSENEIVFNSDEMKSPKVFDLSSISIEHLSLIDTETLEAIISDPKLKIRSEDWLLHTIIELGPSYSELFRFVRFEFLSGEGISEFIDNFEYLSLTEEIWIGIIRRLRNEMDSSLKQQRYGQKEPSIVMLGLDESGKTTALYQLKLGESVVTIPTIGFNIETIDHKGFNLNIFDVGGQRRIRTFWRHYLMKKRDLIFVVDSNDIGRIDEARDELQKLLQEKELEDAVLLVYANKQDLPNAIKPQELVGRLKLNEVTERAWKVQGASATTGDGLCEGLDWLTKEINKKG
jgi:small GTP-binding protein